MLAETSLFYSLLYNNIHQGLLLILLQHVCTEQARHTTLCLVDWCTQLTPGPHTDPALLLSLWPHRSLFQAPRHVSPLSCPFYSLLNCFLFFSSSSIYIFCSLPTQLCCFVLAYFGLLFFLLPFLFCYFLFILQRWQIPYKLRILMLASALSISCCCYCFCFLLTISHFAGHLSPPPSAV